FRQPSLAGPAGKPKTRRAPPDRCRRCVHGKPPHMITLVHPRRERPCRHAAEQRDEFAPLHSITSSARPVSGSGTVSPSVLAVLRLRDSAYLTARWIGKSPGLSPLRMRST